MFCHRSLLPVVLVFLSAGGCTGDTSEEAADTKPVISQQTQTGVDESSGETFPDQVPRQPLSSVSVEVISKGAADSSESLSAEHRTPRIVVSGAKTPDQFEQAAREYFEEIAEEIEAAVPGSRNKRIDLRAYDNDIDARSGNLCILHASNIASSKKPAWDRAYLDWRWRLPQFQPSRKKLQIHAEYRKLRESVDELADAQKKICEKHGLTTEEFIELHAYMMIWHSGGTPDGETLQLWKDDLLSKQRP